MTEIAKYFTAWRLDIWVSIILLSMVMICGIFAYALLKKHEKYRVEYDNSNTIENLYGLFHKLSIDYNDWRFSHLFSATPEGYYATCQKIAESFRGTKDIETLKILLIEHQIKEENMAINILLFYEQVFFQHKHAKDQTVRKEFLKLIDRYFKERLLTNPRIIHYLLLSKNGRELHLEEESFGALIEKYEYAIKNNHFKIYRDKRGPFSNDQIHEDSYASSEEINIETFLNSRK